MIQSEIENDDSSYTVFKRRMGLRNYMKELLVNVKAIAQKKTIKTNPNLDKKAGDKVA